MTEISHSDHSSGEFSATNVRNYNPVSLDFFLSNHQQYNSSSLQDHTLNLELGLGFNIQSHDLFHADDELDGFGGGIEYGDDNFGVDDGIEDYHSDGFCADNGFEPGLGIDLNRDCDEDIGGDGFIREDDLFRDNGLDSYVVNGVQNDLNRVCDEEIGGNGFIREDDLFRDNGLESYFVNGVRIDLDRVYNEEDIGSDDDTSRVGVCLGSFRLEDERNERDERREEVDGMAEISEAMGMLTGDFGAEIDDNFDASVAMEEDLGIEGVINLEWEMLMNLHNLNPGVEDEYEIFAGQFGWNESRNLPASRAIVENLTEVVVTKDCMDSDNVSLCAICKDDMVVGEKAKSLPCLHRYHGCCIDPWLRMRNTCPVCRYELPTDDLEYERRRREGGIGWRRFSH